MPDVANQPDTVKQMRATNIRNFVFGVEDSLVSTVGLLSGVAIAGSSRGVLFLTGMVLIFVEAFSMGVGSYLSEQESASFMRQAEVPMRLSVSSAAIMFVSYFLSGFIPLLPYMIIADTQRAFGVSIVASLLALFILGLWGARLSHTSMIRGAFRMMAVGGVAIALGVLVGALMSSFGIIVV